MPAPRLVSPLPHIPHLPPRLQDMATRCLCEPASSADHLLLLADACEELARFVATNDLAAAVRTLVDELRRRAPGYA